MLTSTLPPYAPRRRFAKGLSVHSGQAKGDNPPSCHFQCIAHRGACGKARDVPHNRRPKPEPTERGVGNACLLSTYGSRGDAEPMEGLAVQLRAEERDAPVPTGVMPTGGWR
jgi:hypothetical protein